MVILLHVRRYLPVFLPLYHYWCPLLLDKTRFPSGMNSLTDKIHGLGMKAGIVSSSNTRLKGYADRFYSIATLGGSRASSIPVRT